MSDERLMIPATTALLDGWCGPVQLETQGRGWLPGVAMDGVIAILTVHGECKAVDVLDRRKLEYVRLDLSRAECRDRVARVVAETLHGAPLPGSGYSFWFDGGYLTADRVWRLSRPNSFCAAFVDPRRLRRPFVPDHGVLIDVPGLDDIPETDMDAALAAVAREVLRDRDAEARAAAEREVDEVLRG